MPNIENNTMSTFTIGGKTFEVKDASARSNIQQINTVLDTKADTNDVTVLDTRMTAIEDDRYKPYAVNTASGAIASFTDGADNLPLKSLVVNIDPVQDLHGYDSPWIAGGGKNLTDYNTDYTAPTETTATVNLFTMSLEGGVTYTFSCKQSAALASSTRNTIAVKPNDGTTIYENSGTNYNPPNLRHVLTFTPSASGTYIFMYWGHTISSAITLSKWQVEKSPTYTGYAPYENICPISGWTGMEIQQTGYNVWDEEWEVGGYAGSTGAAWNTNTRIRSKTTNYISVLPNTTYYVKMPSGTNMYLDIMFYNADKTFISSTNPNAGTTFTTPSDAQFMRFASCVSYGTTYNHDISINYPSTHHDYEPYQGRTIPISWQSEAGTVYGGSLDVLSGELVIDRAKHIFGQSDVVNGLAIGTNGLRLRIDINDLRIPTSAQRLDFMCNAGIPSNRALTSRIWEVGDCMLYDYDGVATFFYIVPLDCNTAQKAIDYITGLDLEIVYPLATPIEIQLSANQINSLYGVNNLWADTGDSAVEYRADTKLYIERLTEPDADMIADANIVSGSYFMVGNTLYKATANIASGSAVIEGTNATRKSLATALNEINA